MALPPPSVSNGAKWNQIRYFGLGASVALRRSGRMDLMSAKNILRKLTNWAVMAFVAAVLYVFITPSYRQGEPSIAGKTAEDFPLTVAGRQTRLSEFRFRGKVVVLNFWASYCGSCVEEMPDLDRLQARVRPSELIPWFGRRSVPWHSERPRRSARARHPEPEPVRAKSLRQSRRSADAFPLPSWEVTEHWNT
jgi:thiol-disulfide isomerase/thioredoxin